MSNLDILRRAYRTSRILRLLSLSSAILLLAATVHSTISSALAQGGNAQVWGQRFRTDQYWGVDTYQNTPNPSIGSGSWTGGPNGLTTLNDQFIEAGPTKACDLDCGLHPYGSWGKASAGTGAEFVDTSITLGAGLTYRYKAYFGGNAQWQSQFCYGSPIVCKPMVTTPSNALSNRLPYVASGGESSGVKWGSITTSSATYLPYNSTTYFAWCYTSTTNNVGGTISTCSNSSWTSQY